MVLRRKIDREAYHHGSSWLKEQWYLPTPSAAALTGGCGALTGLAGLAPTWRQLNRELHLDVLEGGLHVF